MDRKNFFKSSIFAYGAIALILLECTLTLVLKPDDSYKNYTTKDNALFNSRWNLIQEDQSLASISSFPYTVKGASAFHVQICRTLPGTLPETALLSFPTCHGFVKAYLDGELIYTMSVESTQPFGKTTGTYWNYIFLSKEDAGKELLLDFSWSHPRYAGIIQPFVLASPVTALRTVIEKHLLSFGISICILFTGILLIILYYIIRRYLSVNREFLYLGIFALLFGFWALDETDILRLFIRPSTILYILKATCLMLIPVPLIYFLKVHFGMLKSKTLLLLTSCFFANFFIQTFLFLLTDFNLVQGYCINLVLIILAFAIFIYQAVQYAKRSLNRDKRYSLLLGLFALFSTVFLDILLYFLAPENDGARFSRIGVFLYLLLLSREAMHQVSTLITLSNNAQTFRHLAYHDDLTRVRNRTAFSEKIAALEKNYDRNETTFVMFDLNNLKQLNDQFGHCIGDQALINSAAAIREAFYGYSSCYRIGGDEFAVILTSNTAFAAYDDCIHRIRLLIEEYNSLNPQYPLALAYGYAKFDSAVDTCLNDTLRRADKEMYKKKLQMKKSK